MYVSSFQGVLYADVHIPYYLGHMLFHQSRCHTGLLGLERGRTRLTCSDISTGLIWKKRRHCQFLLGSSEFLKLT